MKLLLYPGQEGRHFLPVPVGIMAGMQNTLQLVLLTQEAFGLRTEQQPSMPQGTPKESFNGNSKKSQ